jgi:hypothetical protein
MPAMYASEPRLSSRGALTAVEGSLPSARTSVVVIIMGAMLLPTASHAASASAPVRARQIEGGFVSQNVPLVTRVSLGMLKRSNTGAASVLVVRCLKSWGWMYVCTVVGCSPPVVLVGDAARSVREEKYHG